jgi:hypothetical protein
MYNMKLDKNELSLVILGMEALMEQLKDDGIRDVLDWKENSTRYYKCWDIANKAKALLSQK